MKKTMSTFLTIFMIAVSVALAIVLVGNLVLIAKSVIGGEKAPSLFGMTPLVVLSGSMTGNNEDSFRRGDLVIIRSADTAALAENDVIAFYEDGAVITHRIVRTEKDENGETVFVTKGDANPTEDTTRVYPADVIGVYSAKFPDVGNITEFMQTPFGIVIFIGTPIVLFLVYDIVRRQGEIKRRAKENAELVAELEQLKMKKAEV